jgi:hypothetical protein
MLDDNNSRLHSSGTFFFLEKFRLKIEGSFIS